MPVFVHFKVVDISVVSQRPFRMVQDCSADPKVSTVALGQGGLCLVMQIVQVRHLPCCGAEAFLYGPDCSADHGYSPVARGPGGQCFCYAGPPVMQVVQVVRVSQVLVAKITVVIPQLQQVVKSSGVDKVVHMPVVCTDRADDIPVVTQRLPPMVQVYADHSDSPVAVH